eukprot:jgi/Psemu1/59543/gm1.59543_g
MDTSNLQHDAFPSFDQPLATIMQELFDVSKESDSILCDALKNSTIRTWQQFILLRDFEALTYRNSNEYKQLPRYVHQELHLFLTFGDHLKDQGKDPTDHNLYTKETPLSTPNRLINFDMMLNNDAQFEHWLVKFKAKLDANGINTTTFLDPDWPDISLTGYPKALYDKQCAFFWTLLQHVFRGDYSSSCVLSHQWTLDGRQAYFDFVKFHSPVSYPVPVPVQPSADVLIVPPLPDDLKSLFPSFDLELAYILHIVTLNVTQEAHSHLCEALILANIKSWDRFVARLASPDEVAYLEYRGQEGCQPISLDDQQTLNTFIDLVFLVNSQDNGEWYDISQYNRTVFLDLCNSQAWSPGLAAIQNRATLRIPLSLAPWESADVHNITSTPVSPSLPPATVPTPAPVPVRPPAVGNIVTPRPTPPVSPPTSVPIPSSTPTVHQSTPTSACKTDVHSTVDNPETLQDSLVAPILAQLLIPPPPVLLPTLGNFPPALIPYNSAKLTLPPLLVLFTLTFLLEMFPLNATVNYIPLTLDLPIHLQPTLNGCFILNLQQWYSILKLYHLHATLLLANWLYDDDVT